MTREIFGIVVLFFLNFALSVRADCAERESWDTELRIAQLEALVKHLQDQISELTTARVGNEAEAKVTRAMARSAQRSCDSNWTLKRTEIVFANLEKIQLSQQQQVYTETLPVALPNNTRAVIVQVYCLVNNANPSHAYLYGAVHQEGNAEQGTAKLENKHFNVYANSFNYEVMVPWDAKHSNKLVVDVTSSYNSGEYPEQGNVNW